MQEVSDAREAGDSDREQYSQKMVDYFTSQLNESNPILTEISDSMTEEGRCRDMIASLQGKGDEISIGEWKHKETEAIKRKTEGTTKLMECSSRYNQKMKSIRQARI
jgi:hypothetical protein